MIKSHFHITKHLIIVRIQRLGIDWSNISRLLIWVRIVGVTQGWLAFFEGQTQDQGGTIVWGVHDLMKGALFIDQTNMTIPDISHQTYLTRPIIPDIFYQTHHTRHIKTDTPNQSMNPRIYIMLTWRGQLQLRSSHSRLYNQFTFIQMLHLTQHACNGRLINLWSKVKHLLEMGWLAFSMENLIGHYGRCSHWSAHVISRLVGLDLGVLGWHWSAHIMSWMVGLYWGAGHFSNLCVLMRARLFPALMLEVTGRGL